ncbi:glycosyltransferase family 4 protein [Roseiconus lacunae]|uniref:glycosyltransferase family 4 protein n=1 Tax=Roseiconus lacunae TaxID=2605694 RepID=UPI0011F1278F|nr:glycosyltransferase family 4 protein [Roseiconus lacunae]
MPRPRIIAFMATASPVGGVATWLDQFAADCANHGADLIIALAKGQQAHDPDRYLEYHPGIESMIVDGRGLTRESRIRACQRVIRKTQPTLALPLGVIDANAAVIREKRRRPIYLVSRAQGNLPPMLADLQDLRDGIDHVVCVGAMTRRFLIEQSGFDKERVTHIPNGARPASEHRVPRGDHPIRLGFIGRLTPGDKRVMDIPDFCAALIRRGVNFQMTIAGSGPCEAELRSRLTPFSANVTMLGAQTSAQIDREVLPNLDVLVLFSSSETFGIVLAEAMMNGVVPVTARYLGFKSERLVVDRVHGRSFPVGDTEAAAAIIEALAVDPKQLHRLSTNAAEHARKCYTWERCLASWRELIVRVQSVAPRKPPSHLGDPPLQYNGRLDRLPLPSNVVDVFRRIRRKVGQSTRIDGQEWPLFHRHHTQDRLDEILESSRRLEVEAVCQNC